MYWLVNFYKMLNDRNFCAMSSDSDKANSFSNEKISFLDIKEFVGNVSFVCAFFHSTMVGYVAKV